MTREISTEETVADVESMGLLSMEEKPEKGPSTRALAVVFASTAMLMVVAFVMHGRHEQSDPAVAESSILDIVSKFDCDAGLANAAIGWSVPKKEWCCANQQKGCGLTEEYDCEAGFWNWQNGWSEEKKTWCCQNKQKACPGDPSPPGPASGSAEVQPADASFDCDEGLANAAIGWSVPKKEWCCANQQKGCGLTEDYDCEAGFWNWQNGWSEEKKTWCCQNKQKACPGDPAPPGPASGSAEVQPADASFDCDEGLANAAIGWSDPKKEWCCANQQKGCGLTEEYDCEAGFANWQAGWSEEKKTWCCQNKQVACA